MKTKNNKNQLGLRIPEELYSRLEKHVIKIGISKQAFILGLIFRELEEKETNTRAGDD